MATPSTPDRDADEIRSIFLPEEADDDVVARVKAAAALPKEIAAAKYLGVTPLQLSAAAFAMHEHAHTGERFSFTEQVQDEARTAMQEQQGFPGERVNSADIVSTYAWAEGKVREEVRAYLVSRDFLSALGSDREAESAMQGSPQAATIRGLEIPRAVLQAMQPILHVLSDKPISIPEIRRRVVHCLGGRSVSEKGTIFPAVTLLVRDGLTRPFGKKSGYVITEEGIAARRPREEWS